MDGDGSRTRRQGPRTFTAGLGVAAFLVSSAAHAAPSSDAARAEALFAEGRKLMAAHDYAAACPKFADSESLDPAPGTALNLAACYEAESKLASAWAAFKTAEALSNSAGQRPRAEAARKKAGALEARVSRVTIGVPNALRVAGLEVRCDGETIREAEWGVPVPRDGGVHEIEASAPGKKAWTRRIEVKDGGDSVQVDVPPLEDAPSVAASPRSQGGAPVPTASTPASGTSSEPTASANLGDTGEQRGETQRIVGLVVGGLGVAAVAFGSVAGVLASSKYSDAKNACGPAYPICPAESSAFGLRDTALTWATASTIAFAAGGAAVAAGAIVFLTAPRASTTPAMGIGPAQQGAGLSLAGRF
jgi:tetratricopeptide (TPR) repeat protein